MFSYVRAQGYLLVRLLIPQSCPTRLCLANEYVFWIHHWDFVTVWRENRWVRLREWKKSEIRGRGQSYKLFVIKIRQDLQPYKFGATCWYNRLVLASMSFNKSSSFTSRAGFLSRPGIPNFVGGILDIEYAEWFETLWAMKQYFNVLIEEEKKFWSLEISVVYRVSFGASNKEDDRNLQNLQKLYGQTGWWDLSSFCNALLLLALSPRKGHDNG